MKRAERLIGLAAGIAAILALILQILQWIWPSPFAFSSVMQFIPIIFLIGVAVLVVVIWRVAFSPQAENKWKYILLATCLGAIVYTGWVGTRFGNSSVVSDQSLPLYSQVSNVAWNAIGNDQYELAISVADVCISTYESQAVRIQQGLIANGEPPPPVGTINDNGIKQKVFARGVLNDVATCYCIKALAMEKLGRISEAKAAYNSAQSYPHARAFDPKQNLFWSPAQIAAEQLVQLP